jgi:hypothetical protein
MKNKFEALKAFMSWPREWQELCAEFWASDDEPKVSVWTTSDKLATAGQLMQAEPQRAAKPKRKLEEWSIAQQEHLVECMNQCGSQKHAAEMFLKRYPGRKPGAVKIKIYNMTDANGVMHVRY